MDRRRAKTLVSLAGIAAAITFTAAPAVAATPGNGEAADPAVPTKVLGTSVTKSAVVPAVAAATSVKSATAPASATSGLAFTGSDAILGGLVVGAALVAAGTGLRVGGRRRSGLATS